MTTLVQTPAFAPFGAITTFGIVQRISRMHEAYTAWNERRRTAAQLRKLSPRLLNDIGLLPGDVDGYHRF